MLPEPAGAASKHQHQLCQVVINPLRLYSGALSLAARAALYCTGCLRHSQTKYLNQCAYLPPSWHSNEVPFRHNLHPSDVKKKKKKNHNHVTIGYLLFQTLFSTVDMCMVSFSQGNGMLQDPNHTRGLLCLLDPFYLISPQHLWRQFPMIRSHWVNEPQAWMNWKRWKSVSQTQKSQMQFGDFHIFLIACFLFWYCHQSVRLTVMATSTSLPQLHSSANYLNSCPINYNLRKDRTCLICR